MMLTMKMYEELGKRGTGNSKIYVGLLSPIVSEMTSFLQFIKCEFSDYPDHGIAHSIRISNYIATVLEKSIEKLTDTELFCFLLSTLFHDAGMALVGYDNKDRLRENHSYNAAIVIDKYFDKNLRLLGSVDRIKNVVTFVSEAHMLPIEELYRDQRFSKVDTINGDNVRYSLLSILLRIGDLMDLDGDRVSLLALEMFPDRFSKEATNHNLRHLNVNLYRYDSEKIEIEVLSKNILQHKIWRTWLKYLDQDILYANTYLKDMEFYFPKPETRIITDENADYSAEEIRFEIDDKGGIWNILSQSIYTNELDFIREIVQNAIDATLMNVYADTTISLDHPSPRSWQKHLAGKEVIVSYSEKKNRLLVIDQGIGMNKADLSRFLFKVSSSGYTDANRRDFPFPAIAKYGIGFVSCLICAEEIEIYTTKAQENHTYKVSLDTKSNLAFIENYPFNNCNGTIIALKLKHAFSFDRIQRYIQETFLYPSVSINVINMDSFLTIRDHMAVSLKDEDVYKNPTILRNLIAHTTTLQRDHLKPINSHRFQLERIIERVDKIRMWLLENAESEPGYSDAKKTLDFKKSIKSLVDDFLYEQLKETFPFKTSEITEKRLFTDMEFYSKALESFSEKVNRELAIVQKQYLNYPNFQYPIVNGVVSFGLTHKYTILFMDSELKISSVQVSDIPIDLSDAQGILLMNHSYQDFNDGLEYEAINGFLFGDGRICSSMVKIVGEYYRSGGDRVAKGIVVTLDGVQTLDDCLEEYLYDSTYDLEEEPMFIPVNDEFYNYRFGFKPMPTCVYISADHRGFFKANKAYLEDVESKSVSGQKMNLADYIACSENEEKTLEMSQCIRIDSTKSLYCQDGIVIPDEISALFPVGYFRIICNTTYNSRRALNVTRHELSQLPMDADKWLKMKGYDLQKLLVEHVIDTLNSFRLEADLLEMIKENDTNSWLSQQYHQNFKTLVAARNRLISSKK